MRGIETSQYEWVHGKAPRGRGYWGFTFGSKKIQDDSQTWFACGEMLFSEAAKLALAEAQTRGTSIVSVAP